MTDAEWETMDTCCFSSVTCGHVENQSAELFMDQTPNTLPLPRGAPSSEDGEGTAVQKPGRRPAGSPAAGEVLPRLLGTRRRRQATSCQFEKWDV